MSQQDQLSLPSFASRNRLRRILVAVGILAAVAGGLWYYLRPKPQDEAFRTVELSRRAIVKTVEAAGRLDVRTRVDVPAPLSGRLLAIQVHEGDQVELGQPLAILDQRASDLSLRVAAATAEAVAGSHAEALAAVEAAERSLERARSLAERGFGTAQDVQRAEAELARASAARDAARGEQRAAGQRVASAELEKSLGSLNAPAAGVVLRAPERVGAAVSPDQGPLFVIGGATTTMRIDASVSETEVPFIKPGMRAELTVVALPGRTYEAKVDHIGIDPSLTGGAALYPIRLLVENPEGTLLPGMSARVRIEVARSEEVLAVHEAALRFTPDGADPAEPRSRVWKRMGPDHLEPLQVEAGLSDGTYTEVKAKPPSTLAEGDPIAIGYTQVDIGSRGPAVRLGGKK